MLRAALAFSLVAAALVAGGAAIAQDPAAPAGNYGGGAVVAPPKPIGAAGNMLIGLRVTGGTRLQLNAGVAARCETSSFSATTTLAPDGSFSVSGSKREALDGGRRLRTSYELSGTVSGAAASGTARVRSAIAQKGRATRTCTSGTVKWVARRSTGDLGAPGVVAKARMYGTTSQRLKGPRRAIVLRVSSDGAKLMRALYDITLKCGGRSLTDGYDAPRRNLNLAADGTFSDVERFTYRDRSTVTRATERFAGQIAMAGASGTFSVVTRTTSRRTGKTLATCRTAAVKWTAAP